MKMKYKTADKPL